MDGSKCPETKYELPRFLAALVGSEDASSAGYSWRSVRLSDRNKFERRTDMKLRLKRVEILDPYMRAGVPRMVRPELGDAELTGAYSMRLTTYPCNLIRKKVLCKKESVAVPHWFPRRNIASVLLFLVDLDSESEARSMRTQRMSRKLSTLFSEISLVRIFRDGGRQRYDGEVRASHFPVINWCESSQSYRAYETISSMNNTRKRIHSLMPRSVNLRHSFTVQRTTDTRSVLW